MTVQIPARLIPYLEKLQETAMFGATIEEVVVRCVEGEVRAAIEHSLISVERH